MDEDKDGGGEGVGEDLGCAAGWGFGGGLVACGGGGEGGFGGMFDLRLCERLSFYVVPRCLLAKEQW